MHERSQTYTAFSMETRFSHNQQPIDSPNCTVVKKKMRKDSSKHSFSSNTVFWWWWQLHLPFRHPLHRCVLIHTHTHTYHKHNDSISSIGDWKPWMIKDSLYTHAGTVQCIKRYKERGAGIATYIVTHSYTVWLCAGLSSPYWWVTIILMENGWANGQKTISNADQMFRVTAQ